MRGLWFRGQEDGSKLKAPKTRGGGKTPVRHIIPLGIVIFQVNLLLQAMVGWKLHFFQTSLFPVKRLFNSSGDGWNYKSDDFWQLRFYGNSQKLSRAANGNNNQILNVRKYNFINEMNAANQFPNTAAAAWSLPKLYWFASAAVLNHASSRSRLFYVNDILLHFTF